MNSRKTLGMTICTAGFTLLLLAAATMAQDSSQSAYFPYPPNLIPKDLIIETQRVTNEIKGIERQAIVEWHKLPINAGTEMQQVQLLGKLELYDENLSVFKNVACTSCHMPYTGFGGPISSLNATTVAYPGSVRYRFGKRKPQSYTYASYAPALEYNSTQKQFFGGNFWDLRATGYKLQNPGSEQAQGPPHDTQEMGLPDPACVVYRLSQSEYRTFFETVWGAQAFQINWPGNVEKVCSTPAGSSVFGGNATPLDLSDADRGTANATYGFFGQSIAAYEHSPDVSPFSSKFDAYLAGTASLTADETAGYTLFRSKGNCNSCHLDGRDTAAVVSSPQNIPNVQPLFTDFSASNLGVPKNPSNPFYFETTADRFGWLANPAGSAFTDLGLGAFLTSLAPNSDWGSLAAQHNGQMQTSTVRNVDMRPCSKFVKAYMHNGYLKSLKEVVHFYNTRDKYAYPVASGHCPSGTTEKITCWPQPEVTANVDTSVGNLGLTDEEENQIVAFLKTLTDGFTQPYTDGKTFSGACPE